jgi:hypothetical protein
MQDCHTCVKLNVNFGIKRILFNKISGNSLMSAMTQHGYLVLADISGYTSFVAGTELDHSHEILSDLLETICLQIEKLLTIHKLKGMQSLPMPRKRLFAAARQSLS